MSETRVLLEVTAPFEHAVQSVDARMLRSAFADLTDSAIPQLNTAKLDFDDVLLEHFATFRDESDDESGPLEIELVTLADREHWLKTFDAARRAAGMVPCSPSATRFESLRLRVIRETRIPVPDFSVQ